MLIVLEAGVFEAGVPCPNEPPPAQPLPSKSKATAPLQHYDELKLIGFDPGRAFRNLARLR